MKGTIKRLLCMMLIVAMVAVHAEPAFAADNSEVTFEQVDNERVSATLSEKESVELPKEESPYAPTDVVRVSIILEKAGTIEAGYSTEDIAENRAAMNYRGKVEKEQDKVTAEIENVIGEELDVVWNLTLATNIISANVEYGQIEAIEQIKGVARVIIETCYSPDVVGTEEADPNMATSGVQIGSSTMWAAGYTGAGTKIAIIDTGADIEHEAFNSEAFEYSIGLLGEDVDLMDSSDIAAVLSELNAYDRAGVNAEDLYVNSKVPYGFNYVDENLNIVHINDAQGEHGSHVAGIATANTYVKNDDGSFSYALDTTFVQGVAPDAQLLVMKVFGSKGGAYDSDYMAAIEDAIILGADAVNLSLGSGNPGMSKATGPSDDPDAYQDILNSLVESGVVVAISAGNAGYWAESAENGLPYLYLDDVSFQTDGSPGSYTNAFTVASVNNAGYVANYFNVAGNIVSYENGTSAKNKPMTTLAGTQEFVFVDTIGRPEHFEAVGREILSGKIVMCYRGETSFFEKANAVAEAGAAGVVVVNNQDGIILMNLTGYEYEIPVVSITMADGESFKSNGTKHTTESGITYWTGSIEVGASMGDFQYENDYYTMSSFSSWGVPGSLELKPEITAPGGAIYSVAGANVTQGQLLYGDHASYEVMSGTSMASPQVAGMAALMAQYIRETGLDEKTGLDERTLAQSLLMSTAVPMRDGESGGNYYPVMQQGAGLANVGAAATADSYILMGADATASYKDGKIKAELGDDANKDGVYSFSFIINNLTDVEKTFALSADVFTQDAFSQQRMLLLHTKTTNLTPSVAWTVNGKAVESGQNLEGMDFNGDGVVNHADGQILLDYATGLEVTLHNTDLADLNKDDVINSYDSYLFFSMLNAGGAVVSANGSAEVTVTITLSDSDKQWLDNYENGAYIEAYVYAESLTTIEGEAGTTHSIPVLGFYGNWSDASMYDKGSYVEYANGLENRPPYLYKSAFSQGKYNGLLIKYSDMDGEFWFGGNPMVSDDVYMPERNAFSVARGDMLSKIGFTLIRNAADSYLQIVGADGQVYMNEKIGTAHSAFYHDSLAAWKNTYYTLSLGIAPDIEEDTAVEVRMVMIPEYYVDAEGNINWDALGDGVALSMPMVIDNTAPVLNDADVDVENKVLTVAATDNQYIAAVALYDITGQDLYTYAGADMNQEAGDTVEFVLDLSEVNGAQFLLQVYDYAMNTTTYEITTQIGDVTEELEGIVLDKTDLVLQKGNTNQLLATVSPLNAANRNVIWSSSDESVATVDEDGLVTAVAVGSATITATAEADVTKTATCQVTVIDIDTQLNGIVWDEEGYIWFSEFAANDLPNYTKLSRDMSEEDLFVAATVGPDGTIYASSLNDTTGTGSIYTIDPTTYEVTKLNDCIVQGLHIFYSDLTYAPAMFGTGALLGTYGPYVIAIDPNTGESILIDEYDSELVGIASCYGEYDEEYGEYQDIVYVIQNDGTVIQEIYYGYGGDVVPMMYYYYGVRASMDSGVNVGDAWYFNSAYYDGEYLFWSAFNEKTDNKVTLYAIDADYTGEVYNLGNFAEGVWPVCGLYQMGGSAYDADKAEFEAMERPGEIATMDIQLVVKEFPVKEAKNGGSLNAYSGTRTTNTITRPASYEEVNYVDDEVYVNITAKDINGEDVASHNGVMTVTYDAEDLTLVDVRMNADYTSISPLDLANANGSVSLGYVSMEGVDPDAVIATLVFTAKTEEDTTITVTHEEVNEDQPNYDEVLDVDIDCDHKGDLIFKHFDIAEDFSWAKAIYQCTICGEDVIFDAEIAYNVVDAPACPAVTGSAEYIISHGEESKVVPVVIPATGDHIWDEGVVTTPALCDADGVKTFTCACGETYTEPVPELGHDYETKVVPPTTDKPGYTDYHCKRCGISFVGSHTEPTGGSAVGAPTGDFANIGLWLSLAVVSMAGAAVVLVVRKKKILA